MCQVVTRGWFSRLAATAAVAFAFLFALSRPLEAQLVVSFFGSNEAGLYDNSGNLKSYICGGGGAEGLACSTVGGATSFFMANNSSMISIATQTNPSDPFSLACSTSFNIAGASSVAALTLNSAGTTLYAADYSADKIWALSPPTDGTPKYSVSTTAAHDVADGGTPEGVFTASFQTSPANDDGVESFSAVLAKNPNFLTLAQANAIGLTHPSGMLFDRQGNFWVSNFSANDCTTTPLNCGSIFEFPAPISNSHFIQIFAPASSSPLGIAQGPSPGDNNIYVALFHANAIGKITVPAVNGASSFSMFIASTLPATEPKYLQFVANCTQTNGYIEICKASSTTNPVPPTGLYSFTVTGSAFSSSTSPLTVPVGQCSPPIPVPPPTVTVTELPRPGVGISAITAVGYTPPPTSTQENLLEAFNLQTGTATVMVTPPATSGDTATETIVTFTNYEAPPAQVKICKIAGPNVTPGMSFPFTVISTLPAITAGEVSSVTVTNGGNGYSSAPAVTFTGGGCTAEPTGIAVITQSPIASVASITLTSPGAGCTTAPTVTIAAPPLLGTTATATAVISNGTPSTVTTNVSVEAGPPAGGYCQVVSGTFQVGTSVTIEETVPNGGYVAPAVTVNGVITPSGSCTPPVANQYCAAALIGPGVNEVDFTNCTPLNGPGVGSGCPTNVTITTTSLVSGQVGTAYSQTLTETGGTAPFIWQLTGGTLPAGLTLNTVTGALSGVPTATAAATPLTFMVTDSSTPTQSATATFALTIVANSLIITTTALNSGVAGTQYSQALTAAGGSVPYTWQLTAGTLPAGLTLNASTGAVGGMPTSTVTAMPLTFKVTDSSTSTQSVSATFPLTITASQLTITTTALNNGAVGTSYSQTLAATGGTVPYLWQLASGTLPQGLTLNASTGVLSGTPLSPAAGTSLTFKVTDSGTPAQSSSKAFTLTITAPPPLTITTTALNYAVVATAYSQALTAAGGTGPYTWALTSGRLPIGFTLNAATGVLSGTPTSASPGTMLGFQVTDASSPQQTATAIFILVIATTPASLQITTSSLHTGAMGVPYSQTLTAIGGTGPYTWQLTAGTLPAGLTLNASTGVLSGTPPTTVSATPLTFRVTDASTPPQTATAVFTLTIATQQTNIPLTITTTALGNGVAGTAYSQALTATGGTAPYTWQLTAGRLPIGLTLNAATGVISGTPTSTMGTLLTFQVTDASSPTQTATATFALTIGSTL